MRLFFIFYLMPLSLIAMDKDKVEKAEKEVREAWHCISGELTLEAISCSFIDHINKAEETEHNNKEYLSPAFYRFLYQNQVLSCLTRARERKRTLNTINTAHVQKIAASIPLDCSGIPIDHIKKFDHWLRNVGFMAATAEKAVILLEQCEEKMRKKAGL